MKGSKEDSDIPADNKDTFVFGSPDAYDKLSSSERESLTAAMQGNHKQWVEKDKHG